MKILGNRVLLQHIIREQVGAIFVPEESQKSYNSSGPQVYLVIQVGPGLQHKSGKIIPIPCEPGDRVICHSYTAGPADIELPDNQFILTADQILAVIPSKPNQS